MDQKMRFYLKSDGISYFDDFNSSYKSCQRTFTNKFMFDILLKTRKAEISQRFS